MKIRQAASLLASATFLAGSAASQPHPHVGPVRVKPSIEGDWRVNFILPMEAPPGTPPS